MIPQIIISLLSDAGMPEESGDRIQLGLAQQRKTFGHACTELHHAVKSSNPDWVRRLLAAGADVNAPGFMRWTPLHVACQEYRRAVDGNRSGQKQGAIIDQLLDARADVGAMDVLGMTPGAHARGLAPPRLRAAMAAWTERQAESGSLFETNERRDGYPEPIERWRERPAQKRLGLHPQWRGDMWALSSGLTRKTWLETQLDSLGEAA